MHSLPFPAFPRPMSWSISGTQESLQVLTWWSKFSLASKFSQLFIPKASSVA